MITFPKTHPSMDKGKWDLEARLSGITVNTLISGLFWASNLWWETGNEICPDTIMRIYDYIIDICDPSRNH